MKAEKPMRVFQSPLSGRFYATTAYRQTSDDIIITGKKYDVTADIRSFLDEQAPAKGEWE